MQKPFLVLSEPFAASTTLSFGTAIKEFFKIEPIICPNSSPKTTKTPDFSNTTIQ
jgi:hypothetical protein